jgi:hypothetical protein
LSFRHDFVDFVGYEFELINKLINFYLNILGCGFHCKFEFRFQLPVFFHHEFGYLVLLEGADDCDCYKSTCLVFFEHDILAAGEISSELQDVQSIQRHLEDVH